MLTLRFLYLCVFYLREIFVKCKFFIFLLLLILTVNATEFPNFYKDFMDMGEHSLKHMDDVYPELLGLSLITGALVWKYDETIRDNLVNTDKKRFENQFLNATTLPAKWYGKSSKNVVLLYSGITASSFLYGKIADEDKAVETSYVLLESMFFTAGIIELSKMILGRSRPYNNQGNKYFDFFTFHEPHHSMPSGHTAMAFSLANTLAMSSDSYWVKVPCYAFGLSAGLQRIGSDVHWTSDVIIGGLIGYGVSRFLYNNYYDSYNKKAVPFQLNITIPL